MSSVGRSSKIEQHLMGRWALHFFPFRYLGRKKKAAYSSVVMVQATNLASEKDVKIHIQRSANGGSAGTFVAMYGSVGFRARQSGQASKRRL